MKCKSTILMTTLLIAYCMLLNAEIYAAPTSLDLPALPTSSISNLDNNSSQKSNDSVSFIDSIKKFFGFKSSKKQENNISIDKKKVVKVKGNIDDENQPFIDTKSIKVTKIEAIDNINLAELPDELKSTKVVKDGNDSSTKLENASNTDKKIDTSTNITKTDNTSIDKTVINSNISNSSTKNESIDNKGLADKITAVISTASISNQPSSSQTSIPVPDNVPLTKSNITDNDSIKRKSLTINNISTAQSNTTAIQHQDHNKQSAIEVSSAKNKNQSTINEIDYLLKNMYDSQTSNAKKNEEKIQANKHLEVKKTKISHHNHKDVNANSNNHKLISSKKIIHDQNSSLYTVDDSKLSDQQNKFIIDEAKVLLLPDDDVVLGQVTYDAKIDLMNLSSYIKLLELDKDSLKRQHQKEVIDHFINFCANNEKINAISLSEAKLEAFAAIEQDRLSNLRVLIDNYPLLEAKDEEGYTLIEKAVYMNNYLLTKLLIIRGANLYPLNYQEHDYKITQLLRSAGVK